MDLGVQIALISHQTIIYRMSPNASSRVTSLFVTGLFIFLALGSFTGNLMFAHYDWTGVMVLSMVCCVLGLMVHLILSERYKAIENRGYIQH
jgi:predicted MFS family arabinose efflux permease